MAPNHPCTPLTKIRRKDRAKGDTWIQAFLHRAPYGTMATCEDEQPFLVMRNFVYDEVRHALYLHGARKGRTHDNVTANPRVCFSASEMGRLLGADKAQNVSVEYASVVVFGTATLITDPEEALHGLTLLLKKYFPHLAPDGEPSPLTANAIRSTAVYRIDIQSWSGKENKVAAEFPLAFDFKPGVNTIHDTQRASNDSASQ